MEDKITPQLKKFREIEPDPHFAASSRRTILALKKEPVSVWPSFRLAGALAGLVAAVATGVMLFSGQSASTAFASAETLNQEFNDMNINIELREINYRQNVNQTISSAIAEISSNKLSHLNRDVLKSESGSLNLDVPDSGSKIDQLLDDVAR